MNAAFTRGPIRDRNVRLRLVETSDAELIVQLRGTQRGQILPRGASTADEQIAWLEGYKLREAMDTERYFAIECDDRTVGFVRVYEIDHAAGTFSWGSWVIREGMPADIALRAVKLIYDAAFSVCALRAALFDVRLANASVRRFHVLMGAQELWRNDLDIYFRYEGSSYLAYRPRLVRLINLLDVP